MKRSFLTPAALVVLLVGSQAFAQVPRVMQYQGRIIKADGTPQVGATTLVFDVYATPTAGAKLWTEQQSVVLTDGYYAVFLGSTVMGGLPVTLFDGSERYLEVSVNGAPLTPRLRVGSVAYALTATDARNVRGGDVVAASVIVGGVTVVNGMGQVQPAAAAAFVQKSALSGAGTLNAPANPVDWSQLKGVPAGLADGVDDAPPTGALVPFGGVAAPAGWLLCDGAPISRTNYAALFTVIGTRFGAGDGATTFNLPNLARRFPMGPGPTDVVGATGGQFDHTHPVTAHAHTVDPPPTDGDDGHAWQASNCNNGGGKTCEGHVHTTDILPFPSALAGGGATGASNPPYVVVNYLIKL